MTLWSPVTCNWFRACQTSTNTHSESPLDFKTWSRGVITGLLVPSGPRHGRKNESRHPENDFYFKGRTSLLGNHSITASFELRRVLHGSPPLQCFCMTVHLTLTQASPFLQPHFPLLMTGADYAENVASAQCGILLRDTPAHIQATLI